MMMRGCNQHAKINSYPQADLQCTCKHTEINELSPTISQHILKLPMLGSTSPDRLRSRVASKCLANFRSSHGVEGELD